MNTAKNVLNLMKSDVKLRVVFGVIALLLICFGIIGGLVGDSVGWEKNIMQLIVSGFSLIGSLIFILANIFPKFNMFMCGSFSTVFIYKLLEQLVNMGYGW